MKRDSCQAESGKFAPINSIVSRYLLSVVQNYVPFNLSVGEIGAFHGTSHKHHVPPNPTKSTRVSIDFRVGVEGFYDSKWSMAGTSDEHTRTVVIE